MKQLTQERFGEAERFLLSEARDLERARFRFHFGGAGREAVLTALAEYQNGDGGFGRALEPDVRAPDSSAYATAIGLATLDEIGCPAPDHAVRRAVEYLAVQYDPAGLVWAPLPHAAQEHPRAPWWNDKGDEGPFGNLKATFDDFKIIPRAHLVDLLHRFDADGSIPDAASLVEDVLRSIVDADARDLGGGGTALQSSLSLIGNERVVHPFKERAIEHLKGMIPRVLSFDRAEWNTYCAAPLNVFPAPSSFVRGTIAEAVERHLDFVVDSLTEGGYWEPPWTWMGWYPEAWETAQKEWRGVVTLENLRILQAHGRLA
ncbi:MAG: hypothetical protein MI724_13945 [Spirochaetales bacterium]|nr:hypothetical protein [Spirochaetales bacterium]